MAYFEKHNEMFRQFIRALICCKMILPNECEDHNPRRPRKEEGPVEVRPELNGAINNWKIR